MNKYQIYMCQGWSLSVAFVASAALYLTTPLLASRYPPSVKHAAFLSGREKKNNALGLISQ